MVQFAGKYKLEKNENFLEYLKSINVPETLLSQAETAGHEVTVTVEGNVYTLDDGNKKSTITVGGEWEEDIPAMNLKIKSTAKLVGDELQVTSTTPGGNSGIISYKFSDEGYVQTLTNGNIVAKRYFKRA